MKRSSRQRIIQQQAAPIQRRAPDGTYYDPNANNQAGYDPNAYDPNAGPMTDDEAQDVYDAI